VFCFSENYSNNRLYSVFQAIIHFIYRKIYTSDNDASYEQWQEFPFFVTRRIKSFAFFIDTHHRVFYEVNNNAYSYAVQVFSHFLLFDGFLFCVDT
jgi:hypothetical protein